MDLRARYKALIRENCSTPNADVHDLGYWRNRLFSALLISAIPFSLITIIPTLYWSYVNQTFLPLAALLVIVVAMLVAGLARGFSLAARKVIVFGMAYMVNIILLLSEGLHGAGLIYLLTLSILGILIISSTPKYWSAWLNTAICIIFGLLLHLGYLPAGHNHDIPLERWFAVSSGLVFVSFLCAALIPRLFKGLQNTIDKEVELIKALESEKVSLKHTSHELSKVLEDNLKTMNSSLDVICKVDADGRFIHVSAASEEVWGYKPEELIGRATIDFVHPLDREKTLAVADNVRSGTNFAGFENRYIHKDGRVVPISWAVRWDEENQIRYAVARNITERKSLEQALEMEQQRLQILFQEAPMAMGMVRGPDHIVTFANPLYLQLIGQSDIVGRPIRDVLHNIAEQGYVHVLDTVYQTGESYSASDAPVKFSINGHITEKYLNFTCQAHRDAANNIEGVFFFIAEVTERVVTRKKIEISEARLKDAQALAKMGNWEIDLLTNSHYWSDEMYELFGIKKSELSPTQDYFMSFAHPDDVEQAYKDINKGFQNKENISFSYRFIHSDGTVRHAFNQWKFSFDHENKPVVLSGIIQDVTDQMESQQLREKVSHDLLQRNKDLEQFTYIVSHNLRTPVANIQGLVAILNSTDLNETEKMSVNSALNESVAKLDEVVKDLNQILHLRDTVTENSELVFFSQLVENIKISIKSMLEDHQIEIRYQFNEADRILTLKSYIHSIFYNLITNSIKYRRSDVQPVIKITSSLSDNQLYLVFSDNGLGIDLAKRGEQVFGLYKRFHSHVDGKGLGLFMVKTQVEKLGGTIEITSEVNVGTQFHIRFPYRFPISL